MADLADARRLQYDDALIGEPPRQVVADVAVEPSASSVTIERDVQRPVQSVQDHLVRTHLFDGFADLAVAGGVACSQSTPPKVEIAGQYFSGLPLATS